MGIDGSTASTEEDAALYIWREKPRLSCQVLILTEVNEIFFSIVSVIKDRSAEADYRYCSNG